MGTDYPFPWTKTAVDHILATPGLSDGERVAILEETAEKRFGAPERRRLIAGSSSDRLAAACEELIFDRQCEWRLGGVTCSFAWRL
jgi:hypothetical protein